MATSGGQTLGVTISANMDPSGILGAVRQMQGAFNGLKLPANLTGDILKDFDKLQESLKKFDSIAKQDHFSKTDLKNLEKLQKEIDSTFGSLKNSFNDLSGQKFYLDADYTKIKEARAAVDELKADIQSKLSEIKIDFSSAKGGIASLGLDEMISGMERGVKSSKVLSAAMGEVKQSLKAGDFGAAANQLSQIITKSNDLKGAGTGLLNIFKQWGLIDFSTPANELVKTKKGAELLATALGKIVPEISKDNEAVQALVEKLQEAIKKKEGLEKTGAENLAKEMSAGAQSAEQLGSAFKTAGQSSREMAQGVSQAAEQVKQLQQSTQYFFSLRNMINLLKRGIREAVDVVKELDAAMTETAVVTDYSVGDMWQKLPEYTANANALGATVKDMYEATTLYYQQGLKTEAAMGIANETMKMARIGGLEASDATDKMTAALRGFNMEINEMSAQRVNDVYSNLAAKTASNTEELGTAMQRTASIAHSAGMSFEGTAAFLAQAIETTREPAENLGTAMKTIVARFTELKKNPLEITEVDGEEVSYNKVDTALQSIGVSLKDANGQFRDLDKVFLDISKRWDSLTQTQQRYIATTAAGSRQQSRFIAMMSNYERTMQLMDFANNSAGASNEQFGKTMESLEAKLHKLQNAWNEFLMGIMNDKWTKRLVDAGTGILNLVNKIIDKLSFNGELGLVKSFLSIATAFTALKAGGNIINKLIGGLGGLVDPTSSFGKGFWGAGKTTAQGTPAIGVAGKITTPIVAKLNELIAVIRGNKESPIKTTSTIDQYKNTSAMLRNTQSLGMGGIRALFNGLSDEHAYAAYKNTPGTVDSMKKAALGWLGSQKMPADAQRTGQQLMSAIFKGMSKKEIPIKDGMKLIGKPALWGEYFGTDVAKSFSQQYINQFKAQIPQMKQNTQTALQQTWQQLLGKNANNKAMQQGFLASQTGKDKFISAYKNNRASLGLDQESINNIPVIQNNFQQFANKVGILGSKFSAAGMSLQMFGAQLGQLSPALEGVGTLLSQVGMTISTFGMGISGLGAIVTKGAAAIKAGTALAVSSMAATPGVIGAGAAAGKGFITGMAGSLGMSTGLLGGIIGAVVIGAIALVKGHLDKKAKEAGEEVRENFEKGFTETNKKIDSIEGYKDRFNELSKGVDQFGHNISLTDEEYDEYLSISRDLQELSPSLIAGYNAEGQAILRKGEAIDEVIDKLKEERDLSLDSYISNDSVEKLIKAYNTSDTYKQHHATIKDTASQNTIVSAFDSEKIGISNAIKKAGLEWSDFSQILDELGIGGAASISQLTNTQLGLISDHYIDILNKIKEFNPQIEQEAEEGLKEAFANTNNAIEDVLTEGAPIVDALHQWMGQEKLDAVGLNLGEEFVSGFNSGIEGLMLEGLTNNWKPEEYKSQLKDYANEWKNLAGPTSQYANILSDADEIQQEYLDHIDEDGAIDNYKNNIETTAQKLEQLATQYKDTGAAGEIFAEQCIEQANALRNYATEGVVSLGEALNSLSDEFTAARSAQERFQEATKGGDYYTASEGYKSILDTILDEKNTAGDGSLTFWAGADEILGKDFVDTSNYSEVVNQLNKIKGCFEDGADGVLAFNNLLVENKDKLEGLGHVAEDGGWVFDLQNEDLAEYAKALNMSEEALAGLIDKARQWVPIDLGDPGKIRKAIESSEYSMAGTSSKGESLVYTSESEFRNEARQQGIRGDDYAQTKADAEAKGVRFLNVENLTAKNGEYANQVLDNIGLKGADKTLDNAVAALTKMGFSLEDQQAILTSKGIKLADGEASKEQIEKSYDEQAYALENPTVAGIANDTGVIASAATALLTSMGILTDQAKKDIDQTTSDEYTDNVIKGVNQDFTDSTSRNAAVSALDSKIEEYDSTLRLLAQGGVTEGEYVDKLTAARQKLIDAKEEEQKAWDTKVSEAQAIIADKGKNTAEQQYLNANAVDIQNAFNNTNIADAVTQLREIEDAGKLSHSTMVQLATDFLKLNQESLANLSVDELDNLCTKLGLTGQEATQLLSTLGTPFVLTGRLEGDDLKAYINEYEGITVEDKTILLRTDISGQEKVELLLDKINNEFGDGTEKTKTIILEAEAKLANGDQEGAEKLLLDAGFDENQVQEITERLSITVDGSVANPGDVQEALTNELSNMDLEAEVKAKVSAKLEITNQSKVSDTSAKVNYTKGHQDKADNQDAKVNYKKGDQEPPETKSAGVNYTWKSQDEPKDKVAYVTYKEKDARGRNYSIPAHHSLSFGSAAGGMNVPKPKKTHGSQITALVGEEGFEVGYIPSEARSVIFGANGPEMTSFPKDTIIYPHKQSKEILRKGKGQHITAGSYQGGLDSIKSGKSLLAALGGGGSSGGGNNTGTKGGSSSTEKKIKETADKIEKMVGGVCVWWENIARKTEATQRKMDQNQKIFEKYLKRADATLKGAGTEGKGNAYIQKLNQYKGYNEEQFIRAQAELDTINYGTKAQQKAADAIKAAKATKSKKDDKKAKKQMAKANKAAYNKALPGTTQISYKSGKKTKDELINIADYVYFDSKSGSYQISQSKINKIKNKEKRKAVADAANKELNDRISKKNSAEDAIQKAQEALEKMGEELYETFFAWEVELTKIWNITQKIADHQSKQARAEGYTGLLEAQVDSGQISVIDKEGNINTDFIKSVNEAYEKGIQERINVIGLMQEGIGDHIKDLQLLMSSADEQTTLANVKALVANTEAYNTAQESLEVAAEAADEATATIADANSRIKKDKKIINKSKDKTKVKKAKADKKDAQADRKEAEQDLALHQNEMNAAQAIIDETMNSGLALLDETQLLAYKQEAKELEDSIKIIDMANSYINKGEGVKVNDDGTLIIDFDTDALEADKQAGKITADTAQKIQDHIQKLVDGSQNLQEAYNNLTSELTELHTTLAGLKEAWAGYSEDLMSYLEDKQQKEIDKLKQLSSAIADQMKNLLDQVKRSLDQRRKQEDNQKTEQDISKKQQRLAALQADTSGGHQVEIAQLQQEIADAQTNYQRTLEDQLLDNLQQNTDIANEQRERQISLQEAILNAVDKASVVNDWMDHPDTYRKNIAAAFYEATNYDNLPLAKQQALDDQFDKLFLGLKTNQEKQESVVDAINATAGAAKLIEQSMGSVGQEVTQTEVKTDVKAIAEELKKDIAGARTAAEDAQTKAIAAGNQATYSSNLAGIHTRQTVNASEFKNMVNYGAASGVDKSIYQVAHDLAGGDGTGGVTWKEVIQAAKDAGYKPAEIKNWTSDPSSTFIKAFNSVFKAKKGKKTAWESYATGGLADYTGPAWLDGTPSKPELILNAKDTANFIALKDVLAKAMNGIGDTSNTYGDISYEININVDKIEKDYDVDRVVEKVKKEIVKGAGYRNVTQVRSFR